MLLGLQALYKESKKHFDADEGFKERAQQAVVRLQGGDPLYVAVSPETNIGSTLQRNRLHPKAGNLYPCDCLLCQ